MDHPIVTITHTGETTAVDPILTTARVKAHLRVDYSDDDTMIDTLIIVAQELVEQYCDCKFGVQTFAAHWDYSHNVVHIPKLGTKSAVTFEELNDAGTYVTVDASDYELDTNTNPMRVHMKSYGSGLGKLNRFRLSFTTTIAEANIPFYVEQAMLMIISHLYENRQDAGYRRVHEAPMNSRYLLDKYREQSFI